MVWLGKEWYGMVWYGTVWYGMVWFGAGPAQLSQRAGQPSNIDDGALEGGRCLGAPITGGYLQAQAHRHTGTFNFIFF